MKTHGKFFSAMTAVVLAGGQFGWAQEPPPNPPPSAATEGLWSTIKILKPDVGTWTFGAEATSAILLPTGKVLAIDQTHGLVTGDDPMRPDIVLVDPPTGAIQLVLNHVEVFADTPEIAHTLFCGGHAILSDGRVVFVGGPQDIAPYVDCPGNPRISVYTPDAGIGTWTPLISGEWWPEIQDVPSTAQNTLRWYPTVVPRHDGFPVIVDGRCDCQCGHHGCGDPPPPDQGCGTPQIPVVVEANNVNPDLWEFDPLYDAEYQELAGCPDPPCYEFDIQPYPYVFQMSSGPQLFMAGSNGWYNNYPHTTWKLDMAQQTWTAWGGAAPFSGGSAVMYQKDKILKAGGLLQTVPLPEIVTNRAAVIDLTAGTPAWTEIDTMPTNVIPAEHKDFNLVPLADGRVIAIGGPAGTKPDVFNPYAAAGSQWTEMAATPSPGRNYHGTALLLPNGSVWVGGGNPVNPGNPDPNQFSYHIFWPPYFFSTARPEIVTYPTGIISYGKPFYITYTSVNPITKVRAVRLGAITHGFDMNGRMIELAATTTATPGQLRITAPAHGYEAPPGHYMLFIAEGDNGALPSRGKTVRFGMQFAGP